MVVKESLRKANTMTDIVTLVAKISNFIWQGGIMWVKLLADKISTVCTGTLDIFHQ